MAAVWRVTALFGTVGVLLQYFTYGRLATHEKMHAAMERKQKSPNKRETPFRPWWRTVPSIAEAPAS